MVSVTELQLNIHVPGGQSYSHPTLPMAVDGKKVTTKAARVHALSVKRFGIEEDLADQCFFFFNETDCQARSIIHHN